MLSSRPPIFLISSHSNFSQLRSQDPYLCTQTLRHRIRSSRTQITDAGSPFPSPPPHRSFVLSPCELDSRSWSPPCSDRPSERARRRSSVRRRRRPTPRVDRLLLTPSRPVPRRCISSDLLQRSEGDRGRQVSPRVQCRHERHLVRYQVRARALSEGDHASRSPRRNLSLFSFGSAATVESNLDANLQFSLQVFGVSFPRDVDAASPSFFLFSFR